MAFSSPILNNPAGLGYFQPLPGAGGLRTFRPTDELSPLSSQPLLDPITRKSLNLPPPSRDQVLRLNRGQKILLGLRNLFVEMPRQVVSGLRGDPDFTGSHLLNIATIPYYLGGAVLAGSFAAGGDRRIFARQATGVVLYYLGMMAANMGVNTLCKMTSGVDLDLRYRTKGGDIQKVFASLDWPRFDVLEDADYERMAAKMRIPADIADPRQEVRRRSREVASDANMNKLLWGNALAAFGAGWIARRIPWERLTLTDIRRSLALLWRSGAGQTARHRLQESAHLAGDVVRTVWESAIAGHAGESNASLRRLVLTAMAAIGGWIGWDIVQTARGDSDHAYQPPQVERLSPELRSGPPGTTPGHPPAFPPPGFAPGQSAFSSTEDAKMNELAKTRGGVVQ
jgi:hypothetical protein